MLNSINNSKGVTLLELLAVLVVIGVLTTIGIVTVGNLIDNQKEKAAIIEWNNILAASELYILDENSSFNEDGEFSLQDLIDSGYLTNFTSELKVYVFTRRSSTTIEDFSLILFDKETKTISDSMNYSGVEINGFIVDGSLPPSRPDNRI